MQIILVRIKDGLPDWLFARLKNLKNLSTKKKVRFKVKKNKFLVKDGEMCWWTHRKRSHLYDLGIVSRGISLGQTYLLNEINFEDGDYIIDCGANMGDLQLYFQYIKKRIKYLGIEPNPLDYDCLKNNLFMDANSLNDALWNINSEMKFYVDSNSASSSLIQPPNFSEVVVVKARRLDQLDLPTKIKLLKVEGEGAEPEIIEGARGIFRNIQFITVDVGPERGVNQVSTRKEVMKILLDSNFNLIIENPHQRKTILFKNMNF